MSSVYEQRPWLTLYPEWVKPDLATPFANGVEMFRARARATLSHESRRIQQLVERHPEGLPPRVCFRSVRRRRRT